MVASNPVGATEPSGQDAYEILRRAETLGDEGKTDEAVSAFAEAAALYQKVLAKAPNDTQSKNNLEHCLNQQAYLPLLRGKSAFEAKNNGDSALWFQRAIQAYDQLLLVLPGNTRFRQNRDYCIHYASIAAFNEALGSHGKAPAFSLDKLSGPGVLRSEELKGKVVLLCFWAAWCPECRNSLPVLAELQRAFPLSKFQVVALSLDRVPKWGRTNSDREAVNLAQNCPFPVAWADESCFLNYGSFGSVPTWFLLDSQQNLVASLDQNQRELASVTAEIQKLMP
jgi:thiol-disulfide isomerase/thioredoxin